MNQLLLGDNLQVLKTLPDESVDLIYLDPPFFSNRNYEVIWGDAGEVRSFNDRWSGDMMHYIGWLKERVQEMHRVLKPTGSLYLHCDWHADAYIRVHILDPIFGEKNFRNEIIWAYTNSGGRSKNGFAKKHDTIFWYSKLSKNFIFNSKDVLIERRAGKTSRGGIIGIDKDGRSFQEIKSNGKVYRYFLDEGKIPEDVWTIETMPPHGRERLGYPTQKPEALLERIIKASSNEGDVVLDPFVGGGTTVAVAEKLNRKWIGIDQSVQAIKVSQERIAKIKNERI